MILRLVCLFLLFLGTDVWGSDAWKLNFLMQDFEKAQTSQEKFSIISKNWYLKPTMYEKEDAVFTQVDPADMTIKRDIVGFSRYELTQEGDGVVQSKYKASCLFPGEKDSYVVSGPPSFNAVGLAIRLGDYEKLEKFLAVVVDVNNPHLAIFYGKCFEAPAYSLNPPSVPLATKLKMIDLFAEKGLDFNASFAPYDSHHMLFYWKEPELQRRLLLYGVDPLFYRGGVHELIALLGKEDLKEQYFWALLDEAILLKRQGKKIRPCEYIQKLLAFYRNKRVMELQGFEV